MAYEEDVGGFVAEKVEGLGNNLKAAAISDIARIANPHGGMVGVSVVGAEFEFVIFIVKF